MLTLVRWIEFHVGDVFCLVLSFFRKQTDLPRLPRSILIVRDWSLGESLLTLPVIKKIKELFPQAKTTVLVTASSKPVFQYQPFIDEIIDFNAINCCKLLFRRFDLGLDLMPYFRHSALICSWTSNYVIGFDTFKSRSRIYDHKIPFDDSIHMVHMFDKFYIWDSFMSRRLEPFHAQEIREASLRSLLQKPGIKIGIHLGTEKTAPWRAWAFENYCKVITALLIKYPDITIFLSGSSAEAMLNRNMVRAIADSRIIDLAGRINLFELAFLIAKLDFYLSNDTGPMHIAASMGCPTIGLFGPNTPARFGPFPPDRHVALYNPPAGYNPTINVHRGEFGSKRKDGKSNAVNRTTPEMVQREIDRILRRDA